MECLQLILIIKSTVYWRKDKAICKSPLWFPRKRMLAMKWKKFLPWRSLSQLLNYGTAMSPGTKIILIPSFSCHWCQNSMHVSFPKLIIWQGYYIRKNISMSLIIQIKTHMSKYFYTLNCQKWTSACSSLILSCTIFQEIPTFFCIHHSRVKCGCQINSLCDDT